jgi:hypothetical protein
VIGDNPEAARMSTKPSKPLAMSRRRSSGLTRLTCLAEELAQRLVAALETWLASGILDNPAPG